MRSSRTLSIHRFRGAKEERVSDQIAEEEPLELQVRGASVAVIMRTPGHDEELALGFLVTERVVDHIEDIARIQHCTTVPSPEAEDNVIQVTLQDHVELDLVRLRRNLYASSSCGVCGKATIENTLDSAAAIVDDTRFSSAILYTAPSTLRKGQQVFEETGGLHAAALLSDEGRLLALREDVGRHNAVDKVIGWALKEKRVPLQGKILAVSGRVSFEVVQKAAAARIPLIVAISAPTSLAVRLALALNITLVGFVREEGMNVYAGRERIDAE